jgi:hypothetical protein
VRNFRLRQHFIRIPEVIAQFEGTRIQNVFRKRREKRCDHFLIFGAARGERERDTLAAYRSAVSVMNRSAALQCPEGLGVDLFDIGKFKAITKAGDPVPEVRCHAGAPDPLSVEDNVVLPGKQQNSGPGSEEKHRPGDRQSQINEKSGVEAEQQHRSPITAG